MRLLEVAGVFLSAAAWRTTGLRSAGRKVVSALGSEDENVRTIAGIFLVRAGRKSEPLLQEALQKRENLPTVLTILADIGDRKFESKIRDLSGDHDPQVAKAAKDALRTLAAHQ